MKRPKIVVTRRWPEEVERIAKGILGKFVKHEPKTDAEEKPEN